MRNDARYFVRIRVLLSIAIAFVAAQLVCLPAGAEEKSAEEIAKELANPASSLASLSMNLQYTSYTGDLPGASDQDSQSFIFQPSLPFPVGDKGKNILFRPAVPVLFSQPVFDGPTDTWNSAGTDLADIGFDVVYAGTTMQGEGRGYLSGIGLAGTLPTATDDAVGGDQWRLGPEVFGGIIRPWGVLGGLASHQWDVGGSNNSKFSTTSICAISVCRWA